MLRAAASLNSRPDFAPDALANFRIAEVSQNSFWSVEVRSLEPERFKFVPGEHYPLRKSAQLQGIGQLHALC